MIIAIDPGITGGVAYTLQGGLVDAKAQTLNTSGSEPKELINHLKTIGFDVTKTKVYVERQKYAAKDSRASVFTIGYNYRGLIEAVKDAGEVEIIEASVWMRRLGIPGKLDKKVRKKLIAEKASVYFPDINFYGPRGGLLDGISDACGILYYAIYKENQQEI